MPRPDDFETRREHLKTLSDAQLEAYFWQLAEQIVSPLIEQACTHTTPSIERSVLLRMGFSSLESQALVAQMQDKGLLGHGAGKLLLVLAQDKKITVREAGLGLLKGDFWEELSV